MNNFMIIFNDRSETRGAGFDDAEVVLVAGFYVARVMCEEDSLPASITGWCVSYVHLVRGKKNYTNVNLAAHKPSELEACVTMAQILNLPIVKL